MAKNRPEQKTLEQEAAAFEVETADVEASDVRAASSKGEQEQTPIFIELTDESKEAWREAQDDEEIDDFPFSAIVKSASNLLANGVFQSDGETEDGKTFKRISGEEFREKITPAYKEYLSTRRVTIREVRQRSGEASKNLDFMVKKNPDGDFSEALGLRKEIRLDIFDNLRRNDDSEANRQILNKIRRMETSTNKASCESMRRRCLWLAKELGEEFEERTQNDLSAIDPIMKVSPARAKRKLRDLISLLGEMGSEEPKSFNTPQQSRGRSANDLRRSRRRDQR